MAAVVAVANCGQLRSDRQKKPRDARSLSERNCVEAVLLALDSSVIETDNEDRRWKSAASRKVQSLRVAVEMIFQRGWLLPMRSAAPQASGPASTPVEMQAAGGPGAGSTMTGRSSAIVQMADGPVMYRYLTAWCFAASMLERSRLAEPLSAWQRNVSSTEGGFSLFFPDFGFVPLPSRRS
ncbi:uncharacterized protein CCOS01_15942 [Colletotrichum costaricense]|nr:uncharacterized protein CCOS01_15942 [Colletotrichum costaricense]KAK1508281.1 hypothetical protein CCOS01_15942 [Colletotrichum costaricense]